MIRLRGERSRSAPTQLAATSPDDHDAKEHKSSGTSLLGTSLGTSPGTSLLGMSPLGATLSTRSVSRRMPAQASTGANERAPAERSAPQSDRRSDRWKEKPEEGGKTPRGGW
jgi:hypothetical protein